MLHLHRGERADVLVSALGGMLATPVQDPFTADVVCVPSRGVERWLTQQLSVVLGAASGGADGVCANVAFPAPGRLVADAVAEVSGIDAVTDPWRPGRSVWPLLELIDAEPAFAFPVAGRSRQYAAARHIAQLFDSYATYRPTMINEWASGADLDGAGQQLPADLRWQPRLWRRLRATLAVTSPAERLAPACELLRSDPAAVDLPARLSLFGLTRLPPSQLAVLAALAAQREIHLWLLHPSPALWDRLAGAGEARPTRRQDDPTKMLVRHPLLASLGRDVRELQLTLAPVVGATDSHHAMTVARPADASDSALARLQAAIRADAPLEQADRSVLAADDRSIQVHACHGRARQVEVMRDCVLALLAADPALEPRDIVVMCPDIETYAPLISATFGVGAELAEAPEATAQPQPSSPAAALRVRLADRSLRQTNPMMGVAAALLELVDSRLTASEVLDLAAAPPVRRRFGFDDDDLARVADWIAEAQVKWGLDAAHRAGYGLEAFAQNTWQAGLDRLLLGVAMADGPAGGDGSSHSAGGGWVGRALPLDDVDSTDIELVGRLTELVTRLQAAVAALQGPQPLQAWVSSLAEVIETLTLTAPSELWQAAQLRGELAAVVESSGAHAEAVTLSLADIRELLADRLRGRPTRANFRTGSLTMCTLVPMRSVPHRVVCLLGLDDGAFPRQSSADGDDILLRRPLTGERDARSEDRQLLLDAVLAAGDHLVITYSGADERTNARRPPAVPLGELLDTLEASFRTSDGSAVRERIVVSHPLQPFDPSNFEAHADSPPFSFDRSALAGAQALVSERQLPSPFLAAPLPAVPLPDIEFEALRRFFDHPVKGFLRQRLGITLPLDEPDASDRIPIELDGLARWQIGQRMLLARLSGLDETHCRQAEWRRGALPAGKLGSHTLTAIAAEVEQIVQEAKPWQAEPARTIDLSVRLAGRRRLTGTLGGLHGSTLVHTDFGRINHKRRFRLWLALLLLAAAQPEQRWTAIAVGRRDSTVTGPVSESEAQAWLADLVRLYESGLREPLPIASQTSYAYADARRKGASPDEALKAACAAWEGDRRFAENADSAHEQVYSPRPSFSVIGESPVAKSDGDDWPQEPTRFGVLSRRWWDPMLEGESRARG